MIDGAPGDVSALLSDGSGYLFIANDQVWRIGNDGGLSSGPFPLGIECPRPGGDFDGVRFVVFCDDWAVLIDASGAVDAAVPLATDSRSWLPIRAAWNGQEHLAVWANMTHLRMARLDADLQFVGEPVDLVATTSGALADVGTDGTEWFVVWNNPPESGGTYGLRVDSVGGLLEATPMIVHPGPAPNDGLAEDSFPDIAFGDGVWVTAPTIDSPGHGGLAHAVRIIDGVPDAPILLPRVHPLQATSSTAASPSGFLVSWYEHRQTIARATIVGFGGATAGDPWTVAVDWAAGGDGRHLAWVAEGQLVVAEVTPASINTEVVAMVAEGSNVGHLARGTSSLAFVLFKYEQPLRLIIVPDEGTPVTFEYPTANVRVVWNGTTYVVLVTTQSGDEFRVELFEMSEVGQVTEAGSLVTTGAGEPRATLSEGDGRVLATLDVGDSHLAWYVGEMSTPVALETGVTAAAWDGERWLFVTAEPTSDTTVAMTAHYRDRNLAAVGDVIDLGEALTLGVRAACHEVTCLVTYTRATANYFDSGEVQATLIRATETPPDGGPGAADAGGAVSGDGGGCGCQTVAPRGALAPWTAALAVLLLRRMFTSRRRRR